MDKLPTGDPQNILDKCSETLERLNINQTPEREDFGSASCSPIAPIVAVEVYHPKTAEAPSPYQKNLETACSVTPTVSIERLQLGKDVEAVCSPIAAMEMLRIKDLEAVCSPIVGMLQLKDLEAACSPIVTTTNAASANPSSTTTEEVD
jgi:hypothetical protein